MPKTPAKSPRSISTPTSKEKREAVETPSRKTSNLAAANVEGDGVHEPVVTPARQGGKRKAAAAAAANEDDDEDESPNPKKPKVYVQESVSTSESKGKRHTRTSVKLEIPVSTPTARPAAAGKHIVFSNDDEPSEFFTPQEVPAQKILDAQGSKDDGDEEVEDDDDEEESDSDDDAPEAVSTHAAAAQAAKSAQAATSAAEKQQELQKRKRQERDARFREQAEARKKQAAAAAAGAPPARKKRLDKHSLPAVLPDDFLEAASLDGSGDDDDDGSEAGERRQASAAARFNTAARQVARAESRQPRDQRVGSTVYRVMKRQGDARLAPRMGRHSRDAKEALMGRGRPAARKAGFLVKRQR